MYRALLEPDCKYAFLGMPFVWIRPYLQIGVWLLAWTGPHILQVRAFGSGRGYDWCGRITLYTSRIPISRGARAAAGAGACSAVATPTRCSSWQGQCGTLHSTTIRTYGNDTSRL